MSSSNNITTANNPLGTSPVGKLMWKFSVPATISMLVGSLYNIVDQIFIGQGVGMLGNAATNIAFPISILSTALALLIGIGGASGFNLESGKGNDKKAVNIMGVSIGCLVICGTVLMIIALAFGSPLMKFFGASKNVLPYAVDYVTYTAYGMPFLTLTTGGNHLIRADRNPTISMICMMTGAILNTILDPIFIFVFGWGIKGAAIATSFSQFVSGILVIAYFAGIGKKRNVHLHFKQFIPKIKYIEVILSLGFASFINQIAMAIIQVVLNNTLKYYGGISHYGADIPLAAVGVISKLNMVFMSFAIGIAQGCQPIWGFNYGAEKYDRVIHTYKNALRATIVVGIIFFMCFQIFPKQLLSLFGHGNSAYYKFAVKYLRIFMFLTFVNGIQPMSSQFFTAIGKALLGAIMSLTRQVIFLLPLLVILPKIMGVEGVMFAGPVADFAAFSVAIIFALKQIANMKKLLEKKTKVEL
ncbi:MAG: MATE family efflux transporter [Lachnospiraceae bacterium]|jgi:Na+-driven multidrug efflux pump|nr:MATE family efflux transporter [Lachnospiraceae bacterium]